MIDHVIDFKHQKELREKANREKIKRERKLSRDAKIRKLKFKFNSFKSRINIRTILIILFVAGILTTIYNFIF